MTLTDSMLVPCTPVVVPVPEAAEPLIRSQIGTIERVLARSGVWTKFESGTATPVMFSSLSTRTARSLKRSSQITSLATSRSAWEASSAPAAAASFEPCVRRNASASPASPATRNSSASIADSCAAWSGPGGSKPFARVVPISCCRTRPSSCFCRSAGLIPGVVNVSLSSRPMRSESRATVGHVTSCSRRRCRASCTPDSSAPRAGAGRRSGSRTRSGRAGAGAA